MITYVQAGLDFKGQPRHSILNRCVARFVSDSRVSCLDHGVNSGAQSAFYDGQVVMEARASSPVSISAPRPLLWYGEKKV